MNELEKLIERWKDAELSRCASEKLISLLIEDREEYKYNVKQLHKKLASDK